MLYGWELLSKEEENIIAKGVMDGKVYGGPFHLALFPTDKCNLDCFFCYTDELRKIGDEIEWEVLKSALSEVINMGVKGISFGGGGESFLYKDFKKILDFTEEHSLTVDGIKTNGTAMTPDVAQRLIKSHLKMITISLNETNPDTYAKMGQCSSHLFEKAMNGIQNIVQAKKENNSECEISVQIFIWKENYSRLEEMVSKLIETEIDLVYIAAIDQLPSESKLNDEEKNELKNLLRNAMLKWADKIQFNLAPEGLQQYAMEEQYKISPQAATLPDLCNTPNRIEYCNIGWYALIVAANGDVYPCCHFATNKNKSLGNLYNETLKDIWYGKKAEKYRAEMRHLLLTEANKELLPRKMCFISNLCLERSACAFNFYLSSPDFYFKIHNWAESGPRKNYSRLQRMKKNPYKILRKGKKLLKNLLKA